MKDEGRQHDGQNGGRKCYEKCFAEELKHELTP